MATAMALATTMAMRKRAPDADALRVLEELAKRRQQNAPQVRPQLSEEQQAHRQAAARAA